LDNDTVGQVGQVTGWYYQWGYRKGWHCNSNQRSSKYR